MSELRIVPPVPESVAALTSSPELDRDRSMRRGSGNEPEKPRWWLAFGGFLIFFNIWGLPMTLGAFQAYYSMNYLQGYSSSSISWIGTVQGALVILVGLVSGPLYDLGYWLVLLVFGSLLTVFGMMMLSVSSEYYQIMLSQSVCVGIGCGLLYVPTLSLVGSSFSEKRAIAMGIVTSGIALGGIIYTIVYLRLLQPLGFRWTVRVLAFLSLGSFLMAIVPLFLAHRPKTPGTARRLLDRNLLTDCPFLLFTLAQFFIFLGYLVPLFYIPTFAEVAVGTSQTRALYILVVSQAGSLVGRILSPIPVKYTGVVLSWALCAGISGALGFIWIAVHNEAEFLAFSFLYGFFSGALIALPPSIFPVICPDPKTLGSRMGFSWTSSALAFLIGTPVSGAIIDLENADFLGIQVWTGVMLLVGMVMLLGLWILLSRKEGRAFI